MGRTDRSKEGTRRNPNEGTSARTRAFSFEDIMSRRKKKENSDLNNKDSNIKEYFETADNTMDYPCPERQEMLRALKESVKGCSRKEASASRMEGGLIKRRDIAAHDLEVVDKVKSIHRKSHKDKESTDEKYRHHISRTSKFHTTASENLSRRKRLKNFEEKDEYNEHYKKTKRDRIDDSYNDNKFKAENAKKSKKHDSLKLHGMKYSERNGHKNYHFKTFYEDPRFIRRSRSLEYDPERVRSASMSPLSHKHVYHMHEYRESFKDSSRKKYSDVDRYRTSDDGDRYKTSDDGDRYKASNDGDRYKTSGDADRYKTSGDGDRYKTSGDGDRCKTSGDVERYKTSGDGDRYKTSGDGDRYKASGDGDRYIATGDVDRFKTSGDGDRYKTSGDGGSSSGHHWKHGSGLGGYSPRKRKSEAAVKTPSPTVRSPERKVATWDQLPSGTNIASTGSIFTSFSLPASKVVEAALSVAAASATTKTPHPLTSIHSASVVMNASLESVQLTQATRPMRRLYIENLPPSASEKSMIDHLNEILVSSGANHMQSKPCISCIINKDKAQALVEFLTPEDATAALSFDGNSLFGSIIKMRRPKDFIEAASGVPEKTADVARIVSDVVMDSPYKIFVGGISSIISSKMLMEIAGSFGPLKAFRLDLNKELNGVCAFLEYEDHSITSKACAVLDGLVLGGCILTAVRVSPEINGKEDAGPPSYAVPPHAKPLLANISSVIRLQNVFNADNLSTLPNNELEETLEDIRLECARFGTVKDVRLVEHDISASELKPEAPELESNVECHIGSTEKFDEPHPEEITATASSCVEVIKEDKVEGASGSLEQLQGIDKGTNIQSEVNFNEEEDEISGIPIREEVEDAKMVDDANLDAVAADKDDGEGDDGREVREPEGSGELQADDSDAFVPGCVFVEFQRREAACIAAHCLHGRSYGDMIVEVEYIPYDLYLERSLRNIWWKNGVGCGPHEKN